MISASLIAASILAGQAAPTADVYSKIEAIFTGGSKLVPADVEPLSTNTWECASSDQPDSLVQKTFSLDVTHTDDDLINLHQTAVSLAGAALAVQASGDLGFSAIYNSCGVRVDGNRSSAAIAPLDDEDCTATVSIILRKSAPLSADHVEYYVVQQIATDTLYCYAPSSH